MIQNQTVERGIGRFIGRFKAISQQLLAALIALHFTFLRFLV
jgi:hypothetical protein